VTIASLWVTSLGPLNAINGAIQVIGYIGLIPGAAGLFLVPDVVGLERISLQVLVVLAVITSVLGFIFKDNEVEDLHASCSVWLN